MHTSRRRFLQGTAALAASVPLAGDEPKLPSRILGRTKARVSMLAFGAGQRFYMTRDEEAAVRFVADAVRAGITYFDTADSYARGRSEQILGRGLQAAGGRQGIFLATKFSGRDGSTVRATIERSLENLQVDQLDLVHIHSLEGEADLTRIEARGGVLEAMLEARARKLTRFIGVSSHDSPAAVKLALERHDFDCCQVALNAAMADMIGTTRPVTAGDQSFESLVLPVAQRKNIGVIAMKVFARDALSGQSEATARNLLYYALSLPVATASVGHPRIEHLEENIRLLKAFQPLPKAEMQRLSQTLSTRNRASLVEYFRRHVDA